MDEMAGERLELEVITHKEREIEPWHLVSGNRI